MAKEYVVSIKVKGTSIAEVAGRFLYDDQGDPVLDILDIEVKEASSAW